MPTSVVESQVYIVGHYFPQWAKCFIKAPWESLLDQAGTALLLTEPSLNSDNQRLAPALLGLDYCLASHSGLGLNVIEVLDRLSPSEKKKNADHNVTELRWLHKWRSAFVLHNRVNHTQLLFHKGPLYKWIRKNRSFIILLLITIVQIWTVQYERKMLKLNNQPLYLQLTHNIILLFILVQY